MKKYNNITLGCDPELFVKDFDGNLVSAIDKFGGTKENPKPISDNGHCIQEDNVAVEFNIPPCIDKESFVREIDFVMDHLEEKSMEMGLELAIQPSGEFEIDDLMHPRACEFGCEPDFNAWTGYVNESPEPFSRLRTCGGHIHVGYDNPEIEDNLKIIQAMDLFLGVPSIIMDEDTLRRSMYGNAGAFRNKPFGVEYRVLSNFWISSTELMEWAYENTIKAIEFAQNLNLTDKDSERIQKCINNSDKKIAKALIKKFKLAIIETEKVKENA